VDIGRPDDVAAARASKDAAVPQDLTGRHTDHPLVQIEIKNVRQIVAEAQQQAEAITPEAPARRCRAAALRRRGCTASDRA
ncbi:MAG TPA: hypothetical protein VGC59_13280, partial [Solirubrobacteraceae bacterium]